MQAGADDVRIEMLGHVRVVFEDREIIESDWPARRAQELVALLALADGHRLARDQVIEQLWPHLGAEAGAANLRKAAHHARRTLNDPEAIVLRSGRVELFPARTVTTDVERFLLDAELALRDPDGDACANVAAGCPGELLPDAPYEAWTQEPRRRVHARLTELLRRSADWERLMEVEPTDEAACRELMCSLSVHETRSVEASASARCATYDPRGLWPIVQRKLTGFVRTGPRPGIKRLSRTSASNRTRVNVVGPVGMSRSSASGSSSPRPAIDGPGDKTGDNVRLSPSARRRGRRHEQTNSERSHGDSTAAPRTGPPSRSDRATPLSVRP